MGVLKLPLPRSKTLSVTFCNKSTFQTLAHPKPAHLPLKGTVWDQQWTHRILQSPCGTCDRPCLHFHHNSLAHFTSSGFYSRKNKATGQTVTRLIVFPAGKVWTRTGP